MGYEGPSTAEPCIQRAIPDTQVSIHLSIDLSISKDGHARLGEVRAVRRKGHGAKAAQAVCRGMPDWGLSTWHACAHLTHGLHVCDVRCVEDQRLVERRRELQSRKRCYMRRGTVRARRRERDAG